MMAVFFPKDKPFPPFRRIFTGGGRLPCLLAACFLLSACGIKPADLSPPSGDQAPPFPRVYPAPAPNELPPDAPAP